VKLKGIYKMGLHKNQTAATIILDTELDMSDMDVAILLIYYIKPDGTNGYWPASLVEDSNSKIYVDFDDTIKFDQVGYWILYSYVELGTGKSATGNRERYLVDD
jgi:hypothetical protein